MAQRELLFSRRFLWEDRGVKGEAQGGKGDGSKTHNNLGSNIMLQEQARAKDPRGMEREGNRQTEKCNESQHGRAVIWTL